ncbi:glycosyltransferase [Clostridium neonatale]|uniref:glycosyltransferase n=1 Tax=Clostridium neonatale TaxID=137838 RepID=UPI00291C13B0|nr:glycosyltransferase [Clostridium neonatale]CAI3193872.1 Glycosyltransferase [Clostridium neonatale]CAI3210892.1 Glycosyltransferase [Clostridium neonatale]
MKKVHIIILIDSDIKNLEKCINSIIHYTNLKTHRITLINNNDIENRIDDLNEKYGQYIESVYNKEKCNLIKLINNLIKKSDEDIILLNSNVIINEQWIERLIECAYSEESIGIVSPLCSNWNFINQNELKKCDINEFSKQIARLSIKKYPRISFIDKSCIYIKRDVLKRVGLFEDGEVQEEYNLLENFYLKSQQLGYHQVLCDSVFVYCMNENLNLIDDSKKFTDNEIINDNLEKYIHNNIEIALVLSNKKKNILYLLQSDFHEDATNNIGGTQLHVKDLVMGLKEEYNLYVAARDGDYLRLTIYAEEKCISYKFNIGDTPKFYIFRDKLQSELYKDILQIFSIDIVHIHHTLDLSLDLYYEANLLNIPIITTLHDFFYVCPCIKLVNYENQLCIGLETKEMCSKCLEKKFGIDTSLNFIENWRKENLKALSLCDKLITPSNSAKEIFESYFPELSNKIQVIEHGSEKYSYDKLSENDDGWILTDDIHSNFECIFDAPANKQLIKGWAYLEERESRNSRIYLKIIDEYGNEKIIKAYMDNRPDVANAVMNQKYINSGFSVVVPKDIFNNGKLSISIIIVNDDIIFRDNQSKVVKYTQHVENKKFNVAFIGGMSPEKGSQLAYKIIINSSADINWYVFGGIGDKDLAELEQENLIKTGWYKREDLYSLVQLFHIDLICILPIWPETFCYTLSEALLCGIPILGTDIGAVGERIRKLECGWTIPVDSSFNNILNLVNFIKNNNDEYKTALNKVENLNINSIKDMIKKYIQLYEEEIQINSKVELKLSNICENYLLQKMICTFDNKEINEKGSREDELTNKIEQLENELSLIYESKGYRFLQYVRMMKYKFKR